MFEWDEVDRLPRGKVIARLSILNGDYISAKLRLPQLFKKISSEHGQ